MILILKMVFFTNLFPRGFSITEKLLQRVREDVSV